MFRYILVFVLLGVLLACDSEDDYGVGKNVPLTVSNITGSWQLEATEYGTGNGAEMVTAAIENGGTYTFELDQTYTYELDPTFTVRAANDSFNVAGTGTFVINEETISLSRPTDSIPLVQDFFVQLGDQRMILSPTGPILCIEGCSDIFKKLN